MNEKKRVFKQAIREMVNGEWGNSLIELYGDRAILALDSLPASCPRVLIEEPDEKVFRMTDRNVQGSYAVDWAAEFGDGYWQFNCTVENHLETPTVRQVIEWLRTKFPKVGGGQ